MNGIKQLNKYNKSTIFYPSTNSGGACIVSASSVDCHCVAHLDLLVTHSMCIVTGSCHNCQFVTT